VIFAREISDGLTGLVKKLDAEVAKNQKLAGLGAFVVFLTDEDGFEKKVEAFKAKAGVKHVSLAIDNPAGPSGYKVAQEADLTVFFYQRHEVKANHAFKKGELTAKQVDAVIADVAKILE
jgi:hypothetical protein